MIKQFIRPMETSMFDVESDCCCLCLTAVSALNTSMFDGPVECCVSMFDAVARAHAHNGSCLVPLSTRSHLPRRLNCLRRFSK